MDFRSLYNSIENPFNDEVLELLIKNYSIGEYGTYYFLTHAFASNTPDEKKRINPRDRDKYFSNLFNRWKYYVTHETPEYIDYLIKHKVVEEDYKDLVKLLKGMPDIHSFKEYDDLFWGDNEDKYALIDKYGWEIGRGSSWTHVSSYYVNGRIAPIVSNVEHRLYLNIDGEYLYRACNKLAGLCISKDLPFYFKSACNGNRDDTIVLYSDSEHLEDYINVLRELEEMDPEFSKHIHHPPLLTGLIDGWIGYGSEPKKLPNGKNTSFNAVREDIITESINSCALEWLKKNKDLEFDYKNKRMTVKQLLAYQVANRKIRELCKQDDSKLEEQYGLDKKSLTHPKVVNQIFGLVRRDFDSRFEFYLKNGYIDITNGINIKTTKNDIRILRYDMIKTINAFAYTISKVDPNFKKEVKKKILEEAKKHGIDPNKFCFDTDKRDKLFNTSQKKNTDDKGSK